MTSVAGESLVYRPYISDDVNFIRSSWANSYYKGVIAHKVITPQEFHHFHRPVIDRFFNRPTSTAIVVHLDGEPNVIMGWIAVEVLITHLVIHYVYIKESFKKEGLLSELIDRVNSKNLPVIHTHLTDKAKRIMKQDFKYRDYKYIPHLI